MSSPQNIVESLYAALTAPGNLATALGGRVYYNDGPQNQDQPYLVYSMRQDPIARNFDNSITYGADVDFDIWVKRELGTAGALGAGTIEEYLFALDGTTLAVNGMDRGKLLFTNRGVPEVLEDTIRVSSEARIHGTTGSQLVGLAPLLWSTNDYDGSTQLTSATLGEQEACRLSIPANTFQLGSTLKLRCQFTLGVDLGTITQPYLDIRYRQQCGSEPELTVARFAYQPAIASELISLDCDTICTATGSAVTDTGRSITRHVWATGRSEFGAGGPPPFIAIPTVGAQGEAFNWGTEEVQTHRITIAWDHTPSIGQADVRISFIYFEMVHPVGFVTYT